MTISFFSAVNYLRPMSSAETALSKLSNYFYLNGKQVTVIKSNEVI